MTAELSVTRKRKTTASSPHPWLAQLVPLAAALLQLAVWPVVMPLYWLFFYPAIFLSAWLGGLRGGLLATLLSALLVLYIFIPPQFSFAAHDSRYFISAAVFVLAGVVISVTFDRLDKTRKQLQAALAEADAARAALEAGLAERTQQLSHANERLLGNEDSMRLLISGARDYAIFMLDPDGRIATWNLGAQRLKGWSAEEIVGRHFSQFYSADEVADGLPQRELEMARAEGRFEGEGWRFRKDRSRFWANVVITPVERAPGQLVGYAKVTRDTTERRRIEQAMKEEEARLAAVIGSAMDAVITVDEHQMITLFNSAAEKMFLYEAGAVMGTSLERLIPSRLRGAHASHIWNFAQTNSTRRNEGDLTAIHGLRSDGAEFPIEASISHAQIAGQKIYSVILRDITERVKATEALRRTDATRTMALESGQFGDWQIELQSGIATTSLTHDKIFGYQEKLTKWSFEIFMDHVVPEDRERVRRSFKEYLNEGQRWDFECRIVWPDHSLHWIWARGGPYGEKPGEVTHVVGTLADITQRKHAEALHSRSQKLEALGTLAGGIAHDFNNILLSITGNTKLAVADLPPDHPFQQSLAEIARGGARAADLVRRILTFSRPGEIKRQVLDLQPVVEEALKLVRATIPATIALRTSFDRNLPAILADSAQVQQIVVNLAANAAHAIGAKSEGVIEVRLDSAKLTPDDSSPSLHLPEGTYVRLLISDNGCGMDRATLERIYDPFFTTKGPGEGSGLGLSVVHGIMKNHDGGIVCYSEPQRGTAFRLFFPAAGPAPKAVPDSRGEVQRQRTENILFVDDEDALVALVKRTLERLGYTVTGQTDPVRALKLFRANPAAFDAVVTDLAMPQLSGFDFAAQLLAVRPDLPIVMTSGYVRTEDQERALHMGLRDLILKPDTIEQLSRTLDRLFQNEAIPSNPSTS